MTTKTWLMHVGGVLSQIDALPEAVVPGRDLYTPEVAAEMTDATGWDALPAIGSVTQDGGKTFAVPSAPAPTVPQLVKYAKERRERAEVAGVEVGGVTIDTSMDSQNRIANAYAYAQAASVESVTFKAASGWIVLSLDQLKAVSLAVGAHIQACFAAEDAADAGINASPPTITTFAEVDAAFAHLMPAV